MATAGTYKLSVNSFFYIGSSSDLRRRKADHQWRLRKGIHQCKRIQREFNRNNPFIFTPLQFFKQLHNESTSDFRSRIRAAEQKLLDELFKTPGIENKSRNSLGPDNGESLKAKWQDPDYRHIMTEHLSRIAKSPKSRETREKMAAAKRGNRNPKSRPVIVTKPDGSIITFDSSSHAATFFNVSQQLFDQWMKGISAWPGTGRRTLERNLWIAPYSAKFSGINS